MIPPTIEQHWADFSGKTCPLPGSLPHGNWSCEMQEIPIHGTSFLEEDAQSYPGSCQSKMSLSNLFTPHHNDQVLAKNIGRFLQGREYGVGKFWPVGHRGHHRWSWSNKLGIIVETWIVPLASIYQIDAHFTHSLPHLLSLVCIQSQMWKRDLQKS